MGTIEKAEGDERRAESGRERWEVSHFSLPDPARPVPAFSIVPIAFFMIVPIDREPGTG